MFESRTYEALLASALSRVASPVDKREGSMVIFQSTLPRGERRIIP